MAVVVATRADIAAINDLPYEHRVYRAAEALLMGMVAIWDASGYVIQTDTAPAATVKIAGIAMRRAGIGEAVTLFQRGFISGYDVSGLAYGVNLYAGADGEVADAGTIIIGSVLPFTYTGEKMAYIDVTRTWLITPA